MDIKVLNRNELRSPFRVHDDGQKRPIQRALEKYTEVYQTIRNEDTGLFCDLASYMLMTVQSVDKLNEKLETPVPALQFRPNILLYTKEAFSEDDWEWIKIGERAVVRNVKPCTRFRQLTDPKSLALEGTAPKMGIYCGLYVPGKVKIDDDVFVHIPNKSSIESNHRETK